ncbi:MAG: DNA damage-inducible protein D [Lachnospiraceae bacterium]|nr:DNA damage-inducible protein D [Lachnospiraceae bacterium]
MNDIVKYSEETFENIKHISDSGEEYWLARELQKTLEYAKWENFYNVICKAKEACKNSQNLIEDHFPDIRKTIEMPKNAVKEIDDIMLSRYACYLIVMNGDPRKEIIALGQTYFAVKTRQQEIIDIYDNLSEAQKRIAIRNEIINHNKALADAASKAGVKEPVEYAIFQNFGYRGLYGGMDMKAIHAHKGLKKSQKILDHMGSTELAANLFRATQAEEKLRRENIQGKENANKTHYEVGAKVRKTIEELGGTMPEDLPTPEKSIKQIEREIEKKKLK